MLNDAELLRRYAEEKSEDAFAELVRRYVDLVYSAALRRVNGDAHRAKDVAQVVFTALARKARNLTSHPVLAGWLYTATQHSAAKSIRSESRRRRREQEAQLMEEHLSTNAETIDWERVRPVLDDAMQSLEGRDREAVLLRFFARRSFGEIGLALNLSEDAARMRVERALDKLHHLLARRGVSSTTAALTIVLADQAVVAAPAGLATALTGAALSGGAAAFDILYLMTTTKLISIGAVAAALLSVGTAIHFVHSDRTSASAVGAAKQEHAALLARQRDLAERTKAAAANIASLEQSLAEAQSATAEAIKATAARRSAQSSAAAAAPKDPVAVGDAFLAANPPVKQALFDRSRARVASRFMPLYASLGMSPAQIEQFELIQIEGEGLSSPDMTMRLGTGLSRDEIERRTRELLGDAGFARYREEAEKVSGRMLATDLASALYFTHTPLSSREAEAFVEAVRHVDRNRQPGQVGRDWESLIERVRDVLSPPQVAALRTMRHEDVYNTTLMQATGGRKF